MLVGIQDTVMGTINEELQGIIDLAGHAEKGSEEAVEDPFKIRCKVGRIRRLFLEYGMMIPETSQGGACAGRND